MLTGLRAQVAAELAGKLSPAVPVLASFRTLENVATLTVMVGWTELAPADVACPGESVGMSVWVIASQVDPAGEADDELDAGVDLVLAALATLPYRLVTGRRTTYADTNPAAVLTIEVES